jgi:hypothetical protein
VSVDTYLRGKRTSNYVTVIEDGLKLLVAQSLYREADYIRLDVSDFLFWRKINVEAHPRGEHFHSPACRH